MALRRCGGAGAARRCCVSSTQAGQVALRRGVGAGAARWWRGSSTQAGQAALRRGVGAGAARCWRGGSTQTGQVALWRGGGAGAARRWRGSSTQAGQVALRRGVGGAAARCWRGAAPRQEPWQRHHVSACHRRGFCSVAVLAQCDCAPCIYAGVSRVLRCSAAFLCSLGHSGIWATSGHIRPRRAVRAFGHHGNVAPWHPSTLARFYSGRSRGGDTTVRR